MNIKRLAALVSKEQKQLFRDPSSFIIGIVLPVVMLLIFGYGMSMDLKHVKVAVVAHEQSEITRNLISHYQSSEFFDVTLFHSTIEAEKAIQNHDVQAALFLPNDFQSQYMNHQVQALIAVNASNPSIARMYESYISAVFMSVIQQPGAQPVGVSLYSRMWFNEKNESTWYMIPGVIVIIMAIVGCMLTALQMAKEYEHGNMEQMFVTPMSAMEILLAKMINNYIVGMAGLIIALLMARYLFDVPIRGSVGILFLGGSIFLLLQMAFGLLISSVTKSQFLSCIMAMMISFMPAFLLSGFLYEIPNMPKAIQVITYVFPGRYFVEFLQTIFLVGNDSAIIIKNLGIMSLMMIFFMNIARIKNPKNLNDGGGHV